jgi:polysaccharide biosynthesis/export protein
MRLRRILVLLIMVAVVAGCVRRPQVRTIAPPPAPAPAVVTAPMVAVPAAYAPAPAVIEGPYRLDSGDRLRVVVFGQEGLTNTYAVDAKGFVTLPLIGSAGARLDRGGAFGGNRRATSPGLYPRAACGSGNRALPAVLHPR